MVVYAGETHWDKAKRMKAKVAGQEVHRASERLEPGSETFRNGGFFLLLFFFFCIYFYLASPGLSCGMWNPVPWTRLNPGPPALGPWSFSHQK